MPSITGRPIGSRPEKDATGGRGADVVLDIVGGDYIARNLDLLAVEGRLVQIAFLKSPKAELDFSLMMRKRLWITGSTLRPRTPEQKGVIAQQLHRPGLAAARGAHRARPIIHQVFPLAQAADAHRLMEDQYARWQACPPTQIALKGPGPQITQINAESSSSARICGGAPCSRRASS